MNFHPPKNWFMKTFDRRRFLKQSGFLSIGFTLFNGLTMACTNGEDQEGVLELKALPDDTQVDAWLQLLENGVVKILTGRMELGQGMTVVMQQVVGEELNIEPSKIQVIMADTALTPNEGYTSGSRTVESGAMKVRYAAATARQIMIELAARHWSIDESLISLEDGFLLWYDENKQVDFYELLKGKQLSSAIRKEVTTKAVDQRRWVGTSYPHPDIARIVRGEPIFVQDLRLPGMIHARVVRPPVYESKLLSWDRQIEMMKGVLKVIQDGSFLAVIAEEEYQSVMAHQSLKAGSRWENEHNLRASLNWKDNLSPKSSAVPQLKGISHQAVYSKPYTMHASIGPSCAVAQYDGGQLHIWSHTQGVYPLRSTIASMTGLKEDAIRISGMKGSGCYGHNGADDVAADAAILAIRYPGNPIRVQTTREDEHQWEPYGSAMRMELSSSLDDGKIKDWQYHLWSDSHSTRPRGQAGNLLAARYIEKYTEFKRPNAVGGGTRNAEPYYEIPKKTNSRPLFGGSITYLSFEKPRCFRKYLCYRVFYG